MQHRVQISSGLETQGEHKTISNASRKEQQIRNKLKNATNCEKADTQFR